MEMPPPPRPGLQLPTSYTGQIMCFASVSRYVERGTSRSRSCGAMALCSKSIAVAWAACIVSRASCVSNHSPRASALVRPPQPGAGVTDDRGEAAGNGASTCLTPLAAGRSGVRPLPVSRLPAALSSVLPEAGEGSNATGILGMRGVAEGESAGGVGRRRACCTRSFSIMAETRVALAIASTSASCTAAALLRPEVPGGC